MSQRVTRSSAARLAADTSTSTDPSTATPSTTTDPPSVSRTSSSRKRKAPATDPSPPLNRATRQTKRARAGDPEEEVEKSELSVSAKRGKRKSGAAAMSSTGPSPSSSGDTSPTTLPKDSSRRKSNRKKSTKDGMAFEPINFEGSMLTFTSDANTSAAASSSRKSKRSARKDQDVVMKDVGEKSSNAGIDSGMNAHDDTQEGAEGSAPPIPRPTDDELDALAMMRGMGSNELFSGGYLSRLAAQGGFSGAGLAGLTGHLRAMSSMQSGTGGRLRGILEQLKMKEDSSIQLIALQELSELLLVSNEDNLAGHFQPDQFVKELVILMQPNELTLEANPEIMLLACRCIANLMEALPAATSSVVYGGAVPVLCQKLLEIDFIDLAEQALSTLEKISVEFPAAIVREGGLTACLTYLDFFATSTQRTAVTTAANCCRNIPEDSFPTVRDVMPILLNTLSSSDQRVVEQASLCVSRVIDSFKYHESKLEELVSADLLQVILRLLLPGSTNMIGPNIHTQFLRVLSITARASPRLSIELLKMDVVDTLYQILTGVSPPSGTELDVAAKIDKNVIMQAIIRTPREQIYETLNVVCEILPSVSSDGPMFLDDLPDAGYTGPDHVSMSTRSKKAPNQTRVDLLKECPLQVKRFAIVLFPTLMHAYTSTVNLNVRTKVLTAQLKMLSNFETEILEEALRGVSYASHLASILSQQENHTLVTFALQAAELLLKRLEAIYRPQFYREGVMTEIAKLATRPVKAEQKTIEPPKVEPAVSPPPPEVEPVSESAQLPNATEPVEHIDLGDEELPIEHVDEDDQDEDGEDHEHDNDDDDEGSEQSEPPSDHLLNPHHALMDVQDIVTMRAKRFMDAHGEEGSEELRNKATFVLNDLRALSHELKACYNGISSQGGVALFKRLAGYFDGDALESITSYELMTSDIVDVMLQLLNHPDEDAQADARRDFIEVFMATTPVKATATGTAESSATGFSILVDKLQDLLSRSEHFEVVTVHQNAHESNRSSAASMLAKQLRLKLVADEESGIPKTYRSIMVSIHAIATFKALDDYLRPRISLSERPRTERGSRRGFDSTLAEYTAAMAGSRGAAGSALPPPLPTLGSSLPTRGPSTPTSSKRTSRSQPSFFDPVVPPEASTSEERRSLRRSARRASAQTPMPPPPAPIKQEAPDTDLVPGAARIKRESEEAQTNLECADEAQLDDEDDDDDDGGEDDMDLDALVDDLEDGALDVDEPDPSAVNLEIGNSGKVTARTDEGDRVETPTQGTPTKAALREHARQASAARMAAQARLAAYAGGGVGHMSYASALQQIPQDWHIEFSINGQPLSAETTIYRACHFNQAGGEELNTHKIWSATHAISFKKVQGPPADSSSLTPPPESSSSQDSGNLPPSLGKHPVTASILRLMSILHSLNANLDEVIAESKTPLRLHSEPLTQFVNTKLTAKLNRQLEEPLIVASNCLPTWSEDLARFYPFLFPFETRHLFLQSTSFGYSRSMTRWQSAQSQSDNRPGRHRDDRPNLGRLQRQKVRISRSRILESAIKVMEMYGSSPSVLEVEYFEEVGTGLGPTLEFYSTVSKDFSKKKTKLWRENESTGTDDYAFGKRGLFPAPMDEAMSKSENGQRILQLFKVLGRFVARSMLDSRIIDVSLNPTFFRVGDAGLSLNLAAVATVDQDLAKSLKMLKKYVIARERIEEDSRLNLSQKISKVQGIRVNDARIEDLGLDFTLPGYPHIELAEHGASTDVTIHNLSTYIRKVIEVTLLTGVQRQVDAFRAGFSQVFPYTALKAFTPDELVMLFGRVKEDWSLETLMDSIKADHGFNLDSKSVRNLLQVMSEMPEEERRGFLQFVTGSPKLPIGGFKSLTPMFTVVCKPAEPPYTSDEYLPSVMTCVNYLKMPDYSSLEVLKDKLGVACREGQGSFHLS
nr:hypothetical protein B0A51_00714 [Rachicladosporium sp. CCFEE 5018]